MLKTEVSPKTPSLFQSFIPIIFLIILLSLNVIIWGDATLDGSNQIALLLAAAIGTIISFRLGANWEKIRDNIVKTIGKAMPAILILLLIGSLSGTWLLSGVIPAFIYYGLNVLHPSIFLFATVVISSLISLATGSSWSTIATIGVALLGIGHAMGINDAVKEAIKHIPENVPIVCESGSLAFSYQAGLHLLVETENQKKTKKSYLKNKNLADRIVQFHDKEFDLKVTQIEFNGKIWNLNDH